MPGLQGRAEERSEGRTALRRVQTALFADHAHHAVLEPEPADFLQGLVSKLSLA